MNTVEDRIRAKRAEVEQQRIAVARKVDELKHLQLRLSALEEQLAMLDGLLVGVESPTTNVVSTLTSGATASEPQDRLPSPQVGVLNLLADRPDGMTQSDIIDSLLGKVHTASKNPRAIIRNTVHNLLKVDKLSKEPSSDLIRLGTGA